jgi:hypothetical protein
MKSIASGGGPLVCVEMEVANRWRGVAGSSVSRDVDQACPNDYERACGIRDYLGKVSVGDRDALVLGDMPLETLIWKPSGELPRIVRVYYGDPGVDVTTLLELATESALDDPDEVLSVEFKSSLIVVFDSAYPGSDASVDRLAFEMPAGSYLAMTKQLEPDNRTSVLIHFFVPSQ